MLISRNLSPGGNFDVSDGSMLAAEANSGTLTRRGINAPGPKAGSNANTPIGAMENHSQMGWGGQHGKVVSEKASLYRNYHVTRRSVRRFLITSRSRATWRTTSPFSRTSCPHLVTQTRRPWPACFKSNWMLSTTRSGKKQEMSSFAASHDDVYRLLI